MKKLYAIDTLYIEYINLIQKALLDKLEDGLISIVLFGSVARGEAKEGSDIDLLVVSSRFKGSIGKRLKLFQEIELKLSTSKARKELRKNKLGALVSPIPLKPEEVKKNPPIFLDILTDGIILYDKNDFIKKHLLEFEKKLKALGAKKVFLQSGKWYWDLKPNYRFGEIIEI
ncbi:MAG: nucleotidyltransferase domain-containing protein [Candidatus Bathyarchaeia archaeon]